MKAVSEWRVCIHLIVLTAQGPTAFGRPGSGNTSRLVQKPHSPGQSAQEFTDKPRLANEAPYHPQIVPMGKLLIGHGVTDSALTST